MNNREFKFRVWQDSKMMFIGQQLEEIYFDRIPLYVSFHGILMQYTGLKDVNGKDIFEGDIVKFPMRTHCKYALVTYSEYDAAFKIEDRYVRELLKFNDVIVVGNIFENKELLT